MSRPSVCHHDEGTTWHDAEPDLGISLPFAECDACGVTSIDMEKWIDEEDTGDGWTTATTGIEITWPDCDCAECDPLQPDTDDDFEGDDE